MKKPGFLSWEVEAGKSEVQDHPYNSKIEASPVPCIKLKALEPRSSFPVLHHVSLLEKSAIKGFPKTSRKMLSPCVSWPNNKPQDLNLRLFNLRHSKTMQTEPASLLWPLQRRTSVLHHSSASSTYHRTCHLHICISAEEAKHRTECKSICFAVSILISSLAYSLNVCYVCNGT